jgi:hypothetical protein
MDNLLHARIDILQEVGKRQQGMPLTLALSQRERGFSSPFGRRVGDEASYS